MKKQKSKNCKCKCHETYDFWRTCCGRVDESQVDTLVSLHWYEIMAKDMDITCGDVKRFETKELAEKYLNRDNYLQPGNFKVIKVKMSN